MLGERAVNAIIIIITVVVLTKKQKQQTLLAGYKEELINRFLHLVSLSWISNLTFFPKFPGIVERDRVRMAGMVREVRRTAEREAVRVTMDVIMMGLMLLFSLFLWCRL